MFANCKNHCSARPPALSAPRWGESGPANLIPSPSPSNGEGSRSERRDPFRHSRAGGNPVRSGVTPPARHSERLFQRTARHPEPVEGWAKSIARASCPAGKPHPQPFSIKWRREPEKCTAVPPSFPRRRESSPVRRSGLALPHLLPYIPGTTSCLAAPAELE